jgi:hypothetical protein
MATKTKTTRTTKSNKAKAEKQAPASRRLDEKLLHSKQECCERTRAFHGGKSNIVPNSLRYEEEGVHARKQTVEIYTIGLDGQLDGNTRRIATSDLHQVFSTEEVAKERKKANRAARAKARREAAKAALAKVAEMEEAA